MQRTGVVKITILVALALIASVVVGSILYSNVDQGPAGLNNALTYKVFNGEFVSSVNEAGDIESSKNVEIRCEVKSQGRAGTAILEIVPEGSMVQEGDFLCQFDDSVLQDQLLEQRIKVATDKAAVIQAESDLDTALRVKNEFLKGIYEQELATIQAEVALAQESFRRARQYQTYSAGLNSKGYITKTQLEADIFASEKAELDLKLAQQKLKVYEQFTKDRVVAEYTAEIKKQEANKTAKQYTFDLSQAREKEIVEQIEACRITAPSAGMVVYANETDRRGDASFVIEEGALLRDGQPVFRLPDPSKMQIRTKVSDSKINQVSEGMDVLIRVDTEPEKPVKGVVRKVSSFPMPRRWYQAPIEYEVFIDIVELNDLIRPGLRGKAEIFVERKANVLQAPLSSLVRRGDQFFVLVKTGVNSIAPREVQIGSNNEQFVVITKGLSVDDEVLIDPDNYSEDIEFPVTEP